MDLQLPLPTNEPEGDWHCRLSIDQSSHQSQQQIHAHENPTVKRRKKHPYSRDGRTSSSSSTGFVAIVIEAIKSDAVEEQQQQQQLLHSEHQQEQSAKEDGAGGEEEEEEEEELVQLTFNSLSKFGCDHCIKTFKSQTWLTRHLRMMHGLPLITVSSTTTTTATTTTSEDDDASVDYLGQGAYRCKQCPRRYKSQTWLTRHVRDSHAETTPTPSPSPPPPLEVSVEAAAGASSSDDDDGEEEEEDQGVVAEVAAAPAQNGRVRHRRGYVPPPPPPGGWNLPLQCNVCGLTFSASSYLTLHRRVHSAERPHACHLCQRTYKCIKSLNKHLIATHELPPAITCLKCRAEFVNEELYVQHWNTQRGKVCRA